MAAKKASKKTGASKKVSKKKGSKKKVSKKKGSVEVEENLTLVEKKRALAALKQQVNKRDYALMASVDEAPNTYFLRRPSGIMQLDIDTGGGLPAGGVSFLSGPPNSGKTYLLYCYYRMQQQIHGDNCFIAHGQSEGGFDYWFARDAGVKVSIPDEEIEIRQEELQRRGMPLMTNEYVAELKTQIGSFEILRAPTAEEMLDTILDVVKTNIFNVIGLDSVSALLTGSEASIETLEKHGQQAALASLTTRFMARYGPYTLGLAGRNKTTIIFIAHVRSNRKKSEAPSYMAKYMKEWTTTGGWSMKHWKLIDTIVWGGASVKQTVNGSRVQTGKMVNWLIEKGKAGCHDGATGEIEFIYKEFAENGRGGMDRLKHLLETGMRYGVIVERNGSLSLVRSETGEVFSDFENVGGPADFKKILIEEPDLELAVRREILAAANISCTYIE